MTFDELAGRIARLLEDKGRVVVGISGFAGAGKSHLATKLRDQFRVRDGQVVRLDNIYMPLPRGTGLFDDYDWLKLREIVEAARASRKLDYQGIGWDGTVYPWRFDEEAPDVLIVEGIRLFRRELMDLFDLSIWIDCPPSLALERAKARDLEQGHDDEYMKRWDAEWAPKNSEYFDVYQPEDLVDIVYDAYR